MKYDFTAATENSALLRNELFMDTMSRISLAIANLVSESPERIAKSDAYAKQHKLNEVAELHAEGMLHFGENCSSTDCVRDPTAVAAMLRLLLKDTNVGCAIKSGAVSLSELENLGVAEGIITSKEVDALGRMGATSLAAVVALNMK